MGRKIKYQCEHRFDKDKMHSKVCCDSCYNKLFYLKHAERRKHNTRMWYKQNIDRVKQRCKDNVESLRLYGKQHYKNNADKKKQYYKDNVDKINQRHKQYMKERRKTDPLFRMSCNVRNRLLQYSKLKGSYKTWNLLGCSPQFLRKWLEGQFKEGMNWDNQGQWHIDHILPLCAAENENDFKILAHYSNLQPLWAEDNIKKGGR